MAKVYMYVTSRLVGVYCRPNKVDRICGKQISQATRKRESALNTALAMLDFIHIHIRHSENSLKFMCVRS